MKPRYKKFLFDIFLEFTKDCGFYISWQGLLVHSTNCKRKLKKERKEEYKQKKSEVRKKQSKTTCIEDEQPQISFTNTDAEKPTGESVASIILSQNHQGCHICLHQFEREKLLDHFVKSECVPRELHCRCQQCGESFIMKIRNLCDHSAKCISRNKSQFEKYYEDCKRPRCRHCCYALENDKCTHCLYVPLHCSSRNEFLTYLKGIAEQDLYCWHCQRVFKSIQGFMAHCRNCDKSRSTCSDSQSIEMCRIGSQFKCARCQKGVKACNCGFNYPGSGKPASENTRDIAPKSNVVDWKDKLQSGHPFYISGSPGYPWCDFPSPASNFRTMQHVDTSSRNITPSTPTRALTTCNKAVHLKQVENKKTAHPPATSQPNTDMTFLVKARPVNESLLVTGLTCPQLVSSFESNTPVAHQGEVLPVVNSHQTLPTGMLTVHSCDKLKLTSNDQNKAITQNTNSCVSDTECLPVMSTAEKTPDFYHHSAGRATCYTNSSLGTKVAAPTEEQNSAATHGVQNARPIPVYLNNVINKCVDQIYIAGDKNSRLGYKSILPKLNNEQAMLTCITEGYVISKEIKDATSVDDITAKSRTSCSHSANGQIAYNTKSGGAILNSWPQNFTKVDPLVVDLCEDDL